MMTDDSELISLFLRHACLERGRWTVEVGSCRKSFSTQQAAAEFWEENAYLCSECGEVEVFSPQYRPVCFPCHFWEEVLSDEKVRSFQVRGQVYSFDKKKPLMERGRDYRNPWILGFGGRTFVIGFPDGSVVTTNNLWSRGVVPNRFRDMFVEAEFLKEE